MSGGIEFNWWFFLFFVASMLFVRFPQGSFLRGVQKTLRTWLSVLVIQGFRITLRVLLAIGWCVFLDQYGRKFLRCLFKYQDDILQIVLSSILSGEDISEEHRQGIEKRFKALRESYESMLKHRKMKLEA